jgi:hypothetical protein
MEIWQLMEIFLFPQFSAAKPQTWLNLGLFLVYVEYTIMMELEYC